MGVNLSQLEEEVRKASIKDLHKKLPRQPKIYTKNCQDNQLTVYPPMGCTKSIRNTFPNECRHNDDICRRNKWGLNLSHLEQEVSKAPTKRTKKVFKNIL